jgi:hypothetical protein
LNVSLTNLLNNTGHVLYTTFTSTNGQSHTVTQLVLKNDGFGNTTICNNSASGTTGTIVCNIPIQYQNKSFFLQTFVNGRLSGSGLFTQGEDPNWYGADVIIELFMYSSLVLLMTTHPILIVIGAMLGLVFSISLIWISAGSFSSIVASLFFFVAAGIIIIWQISRKI